MLWNLLPGFLVNLDKDQSGESAWGMTYSSRVAVYKVIPQTAVVGEIFGTTGEAYAEPTYRPRMAVPATRGTSPIQNTALLVVAVAPGSCEIGSRQWQIVRKLP